MNGKPGEFAVCIGKRNRGTIVRCIRFRGEVKGFFGKDRWETDKPFIGHKFGRITFSHRDENLQLLTGTFEEMLAQAVAVRLS